MNTVFIDSSALFAWGDADSKVGKQIEAFIHKERLPLLTTNLVLAETLSLVTKRIGKHQGIKLGEKVLASNLITWVYADYEIHEKAWSLYRKYKDKDFDLIDATSFIVCHRRNIKTVLTLDHHFVQMGFTVLPEP